jgi:integrase
MTLLEEALESYARHLSENTRRTYRYAVREYVAFAGADPSGWTHESAQRFYDQLSKRVSVGTANHLIRDLRSVSRHLAAVRRDDRLLFAEHVRCARKRRTISTKVKAYSTDQARSLLRACYGGAPADLRDRAIIVLGFCTGMRRMSLAGLDFGDFQRGSVDITIKGADRHRVPLSDNCAQLLTPWVQWLGADQGSFFRRLRKQRVDGTIEASERLSLGGLGYVLCERAKAAGLDFHPHIFRYTFVTMSKVLAAPNHVIAAVTGHRLEKSSYMLDDVYLDRSHLASEAMVLQDRILEAIS